MTKKLKKYDTLRNAYLYPEYIPIHLKGGIKLAYLNLKRGIKRILRLVKRVLPEFTYLFLIFIVLVIISALVAVWGQASGKYNSKFDVIWDMKSIFITVLILGALDIFYKSQQSWHAKIILQYNFRMIFHSLSSEFYRIIDLVLQAQKADKFRNSEKYVHIKICGSDIKKFDEEEFREFINRFVVALNNYQRDLNKITIAVEQRQISDKLLNLQVLLEELKTTDIHDNPNTLNDLNQCVHTINNELSMPWRWDLDLDEERVNIIKESVNKNKIS